MDRALAEVYSLVNFWHVIAGFALFVLSQVLVFAIGDSHGYFRAPTDLRHKADQARIDLDMSRGREKMLQERLDLLEKDYSELRGAAINLGWVARRTKGQKEAKE